MGQKVNPISLRININRNFDSSWFHENNTYSNLLHKDLQVREYINKLLKFLGIYSGRIILQFFTKKLVIKCVFLPPIDFLAKSIPKQNESNKFNSLVNNLANQSFFTKNLETNTEEKFKSLEKIIFFKLFFFLSRTHKLNSWNTKNLNDLKAISLKLFAYQLQKTTLNNKPKLSGNFFTKQLLPSGLQSNQDKQLQIIGSRMQSSDKKMIFSNQQNLGNIQNVIEKTLNLQTQFFPIKMNSKFQSAQFVCEYVCQQLQENKRFGQIFKQVLQELKQVNKSIKGIRIVCSGRLGGVEMARIESKKYGQTSLHVFSANIDYACEQAYTSQGLIGVKVWICFE